MDLDAYLARIGLAAAPAPDAGGLAAIQRAHRLAIGFENLDVMLGRPIRIDPQAVFDKLVRRRRGGYCFEHNRLFADALAALGLDVRPLLARVRLGVAEGVATPRTHTCLVVTIGAAPWLADAGFGGSDLPPLPLADGAEAATGDGARHRLRRVGVPGSLGGEWLLERQGPPAATDGRGAEGPAWQAQYAFDLAEVAPEDLEQANHWTSTRAGTRFTTLHVASIPLAGGFAAMTDRTLTIYREGRAETRAIEGVQDYIATLRDVFRIAMAHDEVAALPLFAPSGG